MHTMILTPAKRLLGLVLLTVALFAALPAAAQAYSVTEIPNVQRADRNRFTSNPDGILSPEAVARIDSICLALRQRAIAQVAVVAVSEIDGEPFDFAMELFSAWGVGRAENDNGLGILLVEQAREIRFVTGPGVEGVLTDAICKRIQFNYMLPHFRDGDYSAGMVAGMEAIDRVLSGSELDAGGTDEFEEELPPWFFAGIVAFVLLFAVVLLAAVRAAMLRCPQCGSRNLQTLSSNVVDRTFRSTVIERTMHCTRCGHTFRQTVRRDNGNHHNGGLGGGMWMGGGGLGTGGGGGFSGGGFGGGSFGGGGAGSRW